MDNIRKEFIKEIMQTLKIEGVFNSGTIADEIQHIPDTSLRAFHKALFGTSHSYLNGMDRIIKVAEQFKPQEVDQDEAKAKELIELVKGMNESVYQQHIKSGIRFDDLLNEVSFPKVSEDDIMVLNKVKPFCELKSLVKGISTFGTSLECLNAFKRAITQPSGAISFNGNKLLKG
jgi:hypothetical protein